MIAKLIYKSLMVGKDDSRCSGLLDYEGFSKKIKKKKKKKNPVKECQANISWWTSNTDYIKAKENIRKK